MTHTMSLRMPDDVAEDLRVEAFQKRVSVTSLIVSAIENRPRHTSRGCDVCRRPHTMISTPGGFRFCDEHAPRTQPTEGDQ